jgi:hypothetical protein
MKFQIGDKVHYRTKGCNGTVIDVFAANEVPQWRYYVNTPKAVYSVAEIDLTLVERPKNSPTKSAKAKG